MDGKAIDSQNIYLQHQGREYHYPDILEDDFPMDFCWLFDGHLRVIVRREGGISQGQHHVKVTLGTRRSYTPTMLLITCEKTLTFA